MNERLGEPDETGFEAMEYAYSLAQDIFNDIAAKDTAWSVFSVTFVFLYFCFHLRSLFLATIGITIVLFSFPLTVLLCKSVFQVDYISSLHMFALFTVIGIGADNFFVFMDAWRQSAVLLPP